jgi:hypothetical protein
VLIKLHRQVYSDYAVCEASKYKTKYQTSDGFQVLLLILLIYDIACQWSINFWKRLETNPGISFENLDRLTCAVGKFHLGSHVKKCFWSYSLNFKKGVGYVDGEIMETNWSKFDPFALMARAMGRAHRWELLNDHMRDVNFKKMVRMSK